jgi:hypothetical protein
MSQADVTQIAFPALCLSGDNSVCVFLSLDALCRCSATSLFHNRYYDGLQVFDSTGACFEVAEADPVPPASTFSQMLARLTNRPLVVQLRIVHSSTIPLAEIKDKVTEWVRRTPDFWEASRDLKEWEANISEAPTVPDLVALFA